MSSANTTASSPRRRRAASPAVGNANGGALPAGAASWSCVRDEITGLIWESKTEDGGLHDKNSGYTRCNPDPTTNGGHPGKQAVTPTQSR